MDYQNNSLRGEKQKKVFDFHWREQRVLLKAILFQ